MRKSKAFTLVELLVVIAVIALLMAILMPALSKAKETARRILCGSNQKTLMTANFVYVNNYDGYFVPVTYYRDPDGPSGPSPVEMISWIDNKAFRKLVDLDSMKKRRTSMTNRYKLPDDFLCPSDKISPFPEFDSPGISNSSFGFNATEFLFRYGWFRNIGEYTANPAAHRAQSIKRAPEKLAIAESIDWWVSWGAANYENGWDKLGQASISDYRNPAKISPLVYGPTLYRHNEGCNIAFYDGHVSYMNKKEIFIKADYEARPAKPGMWVADWNLWNKGHSGGTP